MKAVEGKPGLFVVEEDDKNFKEWRRLLSQDPFFPGFVIATGIANPYLFFMNKSFRPDDDGSIFSLR